MNKKVFGFLKVILFLVGFGIIGAAFLLFKPEEDLTDVQKFMWINICVLYAILAIPLFASGLTGKTIPARIGSFAFTWISAIFLEVVGIILTVLVVYEKVQFKVAVIIEVILFFILLANLLWGALGNSQISEVAQTQQQEFSKIKDIRSSMQMLILATNQLPPTLSAEKNTLNKISEEVRFLSPAATPQADDIERNMLDCITQLNYQITDMANGSDPLNFKSTVSKLDMLLQQRKLLHR